MKKLPGLSAVILLIALPAAICYAQEPPATRPALDPADAELLAAAERDAAARNYAAAIAQIDAVIEKGPTHRGPEVFRVLNYVARATRDMTISDVLATAELYRALGGYTDAVSLVGIVLKRDQNNIDALRLLGDIAWDTQDAEQAKKHWELVKRVQPNDFGANWGLGRLWLHSGSYRQAMGYLEAASTVIPSDKPELEPEVLVALAQAYGGAVDRTKAIAAAQRALQLDRQNLEGWRVLTSLRMKFAISQDDFNEAVADASQYVAIADGDIRANGMTPERLERLYGACDLKLRVLQKGGELLFERNPDGSSSDRLLPGMETAAAQINIAIVDTWMKLADLDRTMQHFRILEFAKAAVAYGGGAQPETLLRLGSLQAATGQYADATATLQRVLELDPTNEAARQQLEALIDYQPAPASDATP